MGVKLKVAGWLALGAVAGALATMQLEATARNSVARLPIEELQQLAAVFGMVKTDYVEPVDEKKLISDAIGGMVAGLDPHSQYFDKKTLQGIPRGDHRPLRRHRHRDGDGRRPGEGRQPDRGLARVSRRPEERRPDHQDRRHAGQGPVGRPGRQAHARRAEHQGRAHRLPQDRGPHLPGQHRARGDPHPERSRQDGRAGLRLAARQPVPGPHGRGLRDQAAGPLQAGPEPQGPRARPAQRPGRPARRRDRDLGGVPAEPTRSSSPPTARSPTRRPRSRPRPSSTSAAAAPIRCAACPTR